MVVLSRRTVDTLRGPTKVHARTTTTYRRLYLSNANSLADRVSQFLEPYAVAERFSQYPGLIFAGLRNMLSFLVYLTVPHRWQPQLQIARFVLIHHVSSSTHIAHIPPSTRSPRQRSRRPSKPAPSVVLSQDVHAPLSAADTQHNGCRTRHGCKWAWVRREYQRQG